MKHWEEKAKGWVFLSHSSNDYENVKIVRDYLEENGFSALMFYLKCLEKDKKHLRKELIESEISERNIFVLCDSYNARKSDWVKWEKELVEKDTSKIFVTIDMENLKSEKCTELSKLDKLMNRSTLYFIYDYDDYKENKIEKIYKNLNSLGFKIFELVLISTIFWFLSYTFKASLKLSPHITLVATFAIGIPVALLTNGTVLEALGFTSIR